jgi:hypothetical protein
VPHHFMFCATLWRIEQHPERDAHSRRSAGMHLPYSCEELGEACTIGSAVKADSPKAALRGFLPIPATIPWTALRGEDRLHVSPLNWVFRRWPRVGSIDCWVECPEVARDLVSDVAGS